MLTAPFVEFWGRKYQLIRPLARKLLRSELAKASIEL
jgi:hypothetical protein